MAGQMDFKPTFQCEKITGTFHRMVMHIEEEVRDVGPLKNKQIIARKIVPKREEFNEGYMIYFPQGHSMFVAADDVVESSSIPRAQSERIDRRIDESQRRIALAHRLLVDQSHITGPHRRGKTRSAPASLARFLIRAAIEVEIRFSRDVRRVPQRGRAFVLGGDHA